MMRWGRIPERRTAGLGVVAAGLVGLAVLACAPARPAGPAGAEAGRGASPAAVATVAAGTQAGSAPSGAAPARATEAIAARPPPSPATVRVGFPGSVSDAGVYVAQEQGYFAEAGVVAEDTTIDASTTIQALATGQLDVGGGAVSAGFFNAFGRGAIVRIVADKGSLPPGHGYQGLIVRQDLYAGGQLRQPADLRGRRVALTARGITTEIAVARVAERGGLSIEDVDLVTMGFGDMAPALANRALDAAMSIEPNMTDLAEKGIAQVWLRNDEVIPNQQNAVLLYASGFAQEQTEAARRFMAGYLRGVRRYNDAFSRQDPAARAEVVDVLSRRTSVRDKALYEKIVMPGLHPDGAVNVASLKADAGYFLEKGQQSAPANIDGAVEPAFAQYAVQQLGAYR